MTKRQDLYLQRRSRSEQSDQRQPNQAANISHQPRASPNSTSLASRIEFPTMTTVITAAAAPGWISWTDLGSSTHTARGCCPPQSPAPGFGEKCWSLSGLPSHSLESGGGAFLTVIFGQIFAYSAFSDSHFSSPGSVSGLIASTGHSGTQTPQSMHSSGWMTSMFSPS